MGYIGDTYLIHIEYTNDAWGIHGNIYISSSSMSSSISSLSQILIQNTSNSTKSTQDWDSNSLRYMIYPIYIPTIPTPNKFKNLNFQTLLLVISISSDYFLKKIFLFSFNFTVFLCRVVYLLILYTCLLLNSTNSIDILSVVSK